MSTDAQRCQATTKAGAPCRNPAQPGSNYCYFHRHYAAAAAQPPAAPPPVASEPELKDLVAELNNLADELRRLTPEYTPPPFSPQGLVGLVKQNLDRFAPDMRLQIVRDIQDSLQGTSIDDFKDIETWKGMWFTLNYLVQNEAKERAGWLMNRLSGLPGMSTVSNVRELLADTPPQEFLKPDTWKGLWDIANYEFQNQAKSVMRRLTGSSE